MLVSWMMTNWGCVIFEIRLFYQFCPSIPAGCLPPPSLGSLASSFGSNVASSSEAVPQKQRSDVWCGNYTYDANNALQLLCNAIAILFVCCLDCDAPTGDSPLWGASRPWSDIYWRTIMKAGLHGRYWRLLGIFYFHKTNLEPVDGEPPT